MPVLRTPKPGYNAIACVGLIVSCAVPASAQDAQEAPPGVSGALSGSAYPEFTWDRIPQYMHFRKATSYTNDENVFLAKLLVGHVREGQSISR